VPSATRGKPFHTPGWRRDAARTPLWPRDRRCARLARRHDRSIPREYVREQQRSQTGCSAARMLTELHHGL
jgi:hypothetical protein